MSRTSKQRHGLFSSMNGAMQRTAAVLSALTLTLTLVFAGLLYRVGTTPLVTAYTDPPALTTVEGGRGPAAQGSNDELPAGSEVIDDDSVPLAAPGVSVPKAAEQKPSFPIHLVLGFGLGFAVVFFAVHIYRVNASISSMNRKTRPQQPRP